MRSENTAISSAASRRQPDHTGSDRPLGPNGKAVPTTRPLMLKARPSRQMVSPATAATGLSRPFSGSAYHVAMPGTDAT